jgi:hypothetical protein
MRRQRCKWRNSGASPRPPKGGKQVSAIARDDYLKRRKMGDDGSDRVIERNRQLGTCTHIIFKKFMSDKTFDFSENFADAGR